MRLRVCDGALHRRFHIVEVYGIQQYAERREVGQQLVHERPRFLLLGGKNCLGRGFAASAPALIGQCTEALCRRFARHQPVQILLRQKRKLPRFNARHSIDVFLFHSLNHLFRRRLSERACRPQGPAMCLRRPQTAKRTCSSRRCRRKRAGNRPGYCTACSIR